MSFASLKELNTHLATKSYIEGYTCGAADQLALKKFGLPDGKKFPHAYRWAVHIIALVGVETLGSATPSAGADNDDDDDEIDLFGDEPEDDAAKAKADRAAKAKAAKAEYDRKKALKPKKIEKSLIVLEVKPWEADTDLEMVWNTSKCYYYYYYYYYYY